MEIVPGDKVLVKNVKEKGGTGKLKSFWEQQIYEVVSKHENLPVYKIKPLGSNKVRTLHRNLIMQCNDLPGDILEKSLNQKKPKQKLKNQRMEAQPQSTNV